MSTHESGYNNCIDTNPGVIHSDDKYEFCRSLILVTTICVQRRGAPMDPSFADTMEHEIPVRDVSGLQPTVTGESGDSAIRVCFHSSVDGTVILAVNCDRVQDGSRVQDVVVSAARVAFRVVIDGSSPLKLSINAATSDPGSAAPRPGCDAPSVPGLALTEPCQ
jgi:hypothetical protein